VLDIGDLHDRNVDPMSESSAETRLCLFHLDPRGFLRATMRQGAQMELADAREALAATARLANGRRLPVLVDCRGLKYQTKEAREEFCSDSAANVSTSVALLVGSPVSRVIGNFFLRREKHRAPTQLFSDEQEAIGWLMGHVPS
jgi:hypothetical protein